MKTIGRILLILVVFSIFAGLMVTVVDTSSANAPGNGRQFRPDGGGDRFGGGEGGRGGSRWVFGLIKNVGVLAVIVTVIAWPKSLVKKKKRQAVIAPVNSET